MAIELQIERRVKTVLLVGILLERAIAIALEVRANFRTPDNGKLFKRLLSRSSMAK